MTETEPIGTIPILDEVDNTPLEEVVVLSSEEVKMLNPTKKNKKQQGTNGTSESPARVHFTSRDPLIIKLEEIHKIMNEPDDRFARFRYTNYYYIRKWFIVTGILSAVLTGICLPVSLYFTHSLNLTAALVVAGAMIVGSGAYACLLFYCCFVESQRMSIKRKLQHEFPHVTSLSTYTDLVISSPRDARFWWLLVRRKKQLNISEVLERDTAQAQEAINRYGLLANSTKLGSRDRVLSKAKYRLQGFDRNATDPVTLKNALLLFYKPSLFKANPEIPFY